MFHQRDRLRPIVWLFAIVAMGVQTGRGETAPLASSIEGPSRGLIVHLGIHDGRATAALGAGGACLVQGLSTDAQTVERARKEIQALGAYGRITATRFDGRNLPYADNMVNLLVVEEQGSVSSDEIMRVLAPNGEARVRSGDRWETTVKPWPREADEWTHYLHGPDNNAVAEDSLVGPPQHIQWTAGPQYSKSHSMMSSVDALVSAGGRLFAIADEGPTALASWLPPHWTLVARDAFNGVVLWRVPLTSWQPINVPGRHNFPVDLYRRLVADKDRVFVTLDLFGPVTALDGRTGQTLRTYAGTEGTEEIIHSEGTLFLVLGTKPAAQVDRRALANLRKEPESKRIVAVRASDGVLLWNRCDSGTFGLMPMTLICSGGRLFLQNTKEIVCLDATSGKTLWGFARPVDYARPGWSTTTLLACGGVVLSADRSATKPGKDVTRYKEATGDLVAVSAENGKRLWSIPCAEGCAQPVDVLVAGGLVWVGQEKARNAQDYTKGYDLLTGQVKKTIPPSPDWVAEHHHRCYREKATENYILGGRTGIEFIDLNRREIIGHPWARGICHYGILPCNGLIYAPPHQCGCYVESKLSGFLALAPKSANEPALTPSHPLETGPSSLPQPETRPSGASGSNENPKPETNDDWPTYRHDAARTGYTKTPVPASVKAAWSASLGGKLSAPVCAEGRIFVSQVDRQTVTCLDANSGKTLWTYNAGGRVDSPPTVAEGLAVFGASDGWITALRAAAGAVAWRFRAAPAERQIVSNDHLESAWPAPGSVLVEGSSVYCVAGRSSYVDGGMFLHKLDLHTGIALLSKCYYSRDPKDGRPVQLYKPAYSDMLPGRELPGLLPDILSYDGANIYMRAVPFDSDLNIHAERNRAHLFCSMGFLDDTWWERTYWIFGEHFYSGAAGVFYAQGLSPSGRILVTDDQNVYGYKDLGAGGRSKGLANSICAAPRKPRLVESESMKKKAEKKGKKYSNAKLTQVADLWTTPAPFYADAMVLADKTLFLAGPVQFDEAAAQKILSTCQTNNETLPPPLQDALDAFEGKKGSLLWAVNKADGKRLSEVKLESKPVFDGMIAARGRLYLSTVDGKVSCLAGN